jgi:hypothetical protein
MAGRPPETGENRDNYLRVRLAPFEIETLDKVRDGRTRSDYIRSLIRADALNHGFPL